MKPLLVAGLPRSGTTWVAQALSAGLVRPYVHEPDNEKLNVAALRAKATLGRFPLLLPGDECPRFARLWEYATRGVPSRFMRLLNRSVRSRTEMEAALHDVSAPLDLLGRLPARLSSAPVVPVVKSVHAALCLEWIAHTASWDVVVVKRNYLNVIASGLDLAMPDADRALDQSPAIRSRYIEPRGFPLPSKAADALERRAWQCALLAASLEEASHRNATWLVVDHESLTSEGMEAFAGIARAMGQEWHARGTLFLDGSSRHGAGYAVARTADQLRDRWRRTLTLDDAKKIEQVFAKFGIQLHP